MAIVVNSDASAFKRTANVPARTSATLWGWFMLTTDRNTWSGLLGLNTAVDASNWRTIQTTTDGTQVALSRSDGAGGGVDTNMFVASLNTWYFVALVSKGDSTGDMIGYWRDLATNSLSSVSTTPVTTGTMAVMEFGRDTFTGEYLAGRIHAVGAADAVLSADEILELSYLHEPQLIGIRSLNVFYPTIEAVNTNATVDRSGNGRNATATVGALADSPSLLWAPRVLPYVIPASSTQSYSYTAVGGLTLSGTAERAYARAAAAAGGLTLSGAAAVAHARAVATAGGIVLSGAAAFARGFEAAASGGLSLSGAAPAARVRAALAAGGLNLSGAAGYSSSGTQSYSYSASGGITLAGAAAAARSRAAAAAGGIVLGGAAAIQTHESTRTVTPSGGLQLGGAASVEFVTAGGGAGSDWPLRNRRRRP